MKKFLKLQNNLMKSNIKLIGIASGDWHLAKFKSFSHLNRLKWSLKAAEIIFEVCKNKGVPLYFTGDLFHTPKEIENEVMTKCLKLFKEYLKYIDVFAIPGNHDMCEKNTLNHKSPHYLEAFTIFKKFHLLENNYAYPDYDTIVYGIPYHDFEDDLITRIKEASKYIKKTISEEQPRKILLLHGNAPGATTPMGLELETSIPRNLDKFFKHWDLVLFGHIHKPKKLSSKVYMLGSPSHQEASDEGCEMGYWEIYSDNSLKFIPLNEYLPEFLSLTENQYNYYDVACPKDCPDYITIIEEGEKETNNEKSEEAFDTSLSRKKLASNYLKQKGIKNRDKEVALQKILMNS